MDNKYYKQIAIGLAVVVIVGLCAFVFASQEFNTPATTDSALQTEIAEGVYLTNFPLTQSAAATEAAQTVVAELTLTGAGTQPDNGTEQPTDTPEPPTPTINPDNPKEDLGEPDYEDDFSEIRKWEEFDIAEAQMAIHDGEMYFTIKEIDPASRWAVSWDEIADYYLEVNARTPDSCAGLDRYGIMFRAPDVDHGYHFGLSCDGRLSLSTWDGETWIVLIDWTENDFINSGPNQNNLLGILAVGEEIKLYVNDEWVATLTDATYLNALRYGVFVGADETNDFTVRFDDLKWWGVPD
jgi:hypothetical protein